MQTPEEFLESIHKVGQIHCSDPSCSTCKEHRRVGADLIHIRDLAIRRECAERAQDEWEQLFCDDMIGDREFVTKKLRAAISRTESEEP